jgi:hypothetical protein
VVSWHPSRARRQHRRNIAIALFKIRTKSTGKPSSLARPATKTEIIMKSNDARKETKKKPLLSAKEKKLAKREKKNRK